MRSPLRSCNTPLPRSCGFTLIEILFALIILAINGSAVAASLALAASLVRAAGQILAAIPDIDPALICSGACLVLRSPRQLTRSTPAARRLGLTLVEVLVAIAIAGIILSTLGGFTSSLVRGGRSLDTVMDRNLIDHAFRLVLEGEFGRAGEGLATGHCGLAIGSGGGELHVRRRGDGGEVEHLVFSAGVDGAGLPALYRRQLPHARQPWLEDVNGFEVTPSGVGLGDRVQEVQVELTVHGQDAPVQWRILLPHQPCLGVVLP